MKMLYLFESSSVRQKEIRPPHPLGRSCLHRKTEADTLPAIDPSSEAGVNAVIE